MDDLLLNGSVNPDPFPARGSKDEQQEWFAKDLALRSALPRPPAPTPEETAELAELRVSNERQAEVIARLHTENGRLRHALQIAERAQISDSVRRLHEQVRLAVETEFEKRAAELGIGKDADSVRQQVEHLNGRAVLLEARLKARG